MFKSRTSYVVHYDEAILKKTALKTWTLLKALRSFKIPVPFSCGGEGICTTCRVIVVKGKVSERTPLEKERAEERNFLDNERLSCQCWPLEQNIEIKVP